MVVMTNSEYQQIVSNMTDVELVESFRQTSLVVSSWDPFEEFSSNPTDTFSKETAEEFHQTEKSELIKRGIFNQMEDFYL